MNKNTYFRQFCHHKILIIIGQKVKSLDLGYPLSMLGPIIFNNVLIYMVSNKSWIQNRTMWTELLTHTVPRSLHSV